MDWTAHWGEEVLGVAADAEATAEPGAAPDASHDPSAPGALALGVSAYESYGQQPKRKSPDGGEAAFAGAAASGDWEQLVAAVKAFQRQGPGNRDIWGVYCDAHYGGARDPARHDILSLQTFLTSHASGGGGGMCGAMMGGMGGCMGGPPMKRMNLGGGMAAPAAPGSKDWLVSQVKTFQRQGPPQQEAWVQFCDGRCGGTRDPSRLDVASLEVFLVEHGVMEGGASGGSQMSEWQQQLQLMNPNYKCGWGGGGVPLATASGKSKAQLIMQVKAFQRASLENKEIWGSFCNATYGGTRDPNKHDESSLQMFLSEYANGFVPEENGKDKESHGTGDAAKDELVAKIKAYQRTGEAEKETWKTYAEAQIGRYRDPALHDIAILQHFVNVYGLW